MMLKYNDESEEVKAHHMDIAHFPKELSKGELRQWKMDMAAYRAKCNDAAGHDGTPVILPVEDIRAAPVEGAPIQWETVPVGTCAICKASGQEDSHPQCWHPPMHPLQGMRATLRDAEGGNGSSLALLPLEAIQRDDSGSVDAVTTEVYGAMVLRMWGSGKLYTKRRGAPGSQLGPSPSGKKEETN